MYVLVETANATSNTFASLVELKEWMIKKDPTLFVTPEINEIKVKETILEQLDTLVTTLKNKIIGDNVQEQQTTENTIIESTEDVEEDEKEQVVQEHMEGDSSLARYKDIYNPSKLYNKPISIPSKYAIAKDVDKWSTQIDTQFQPVCKDGFSAHEYSIRTFLTTLEPHISKYTCYENSGMLRGHDLGKWFIKTYCTEKEWPEYQLGTAFAVGYENNRLFLPNAIKYCMYLFVCFPNMMDNTFFSFESCNFPGGLEEITKLFENYNRLDIFNEMVSAIESPRLVIKHNDYFLGFFYLIHIFRKNAPENIKSYPWDELVTKLIIRNIADSTKNPFIMNRSNQAVFPELKHDILQLCICMFLHSDDKVTVSFKSSELLTYLHEQLDKFVSTVGILMPTGTTMIGQIIELMKSFIEPKALVKELKQAGIETVRKSAGVFYKGLQANAEKKDADFIGLIEKHMKKSELGGVSQMVEAYDSPQRAEYTLL